jgi:hypothetical protein
MSYAAESKHKGLFQASSEILRCRFFFHPDGGPFLLKKGTVSSSWEG